MHTLIYALVEADGRDEALTTGKSAFDRLVGAGQHRGAVFDYYVTFDETDRAHAGPNRWGELPTAAPVDTQGGARLLNRGWQATKQEFQRNLDRVREVLQAYSDEDIMRDEDLARHAFHKVGAYDGPTISLYDQFGRGIRHREQLDRVLANTEDDRQVWIVPADVHF